MAQDVLVPPLGQTTETVVLVKWYRRAGEQVKAGEPLFAIETDKATLDIESPASGVLSDVHASEGDEVKVLSAIAIIGEAAETTRNPKPLAEQALPDHGKAQTANTVSSPPSPAVKVQLTTDAQTASLTVGKQRLFVSPRARRLAGDQGVNLDLLKATGPQGAIVERDVRQFVQQLLASRKTESGIPKVEAAPIPEPLSITVSAPSTAIESPALSNARLSTLNGTADISGLHALRGRLAQRSLAITDDALLVYVLGHALNEFPEIRNSSGASGMNIGVLVASPNDFVSPVVRAVNNKGLSQLSREMEDLTKRGQTGLLHQDELEGGVFTFASLGAYAIDSFTLVDQTRTPTFGVGRTLPGKSDQNGHANAAECIQLNMTFDIRLTKALSAVRFFQRVIQLIEDPDLLFG